MNYVLFLLFNNYRKNRHFNIFSFRGGKATVFEGGVRVPGFIWGPEQLIPRNMDYNGLFHVSDFYPTILNMVGNKDVTENKALDGISHYDELNDNSMDFPRRSVHIHR